MTEPLPDLVEPLGIPVDRDYMSQEEIERWEDRGYRVTTDPKTGRMVLKERVIVKGSTPKPSVSGGSQAPLESRGRR